MLDSEVNWEYLPKSYGSMSAGRRTRAEKARQERIARRKEELSRVAMIKVLLVEKFDTTEALLYSLQKYEPLATVRRIGMYLCVRVAGRTLRQAAWDFKRLDHTSASGACRRIEKRCAREPGFEMLLKYLEWEVRRCFEQNKQKSPA